MTRRAGRVCRGPEHYDSGDMAVGNCHSGKRARASSVLALVAISLFTVTWCSYSVFSTCPADSQAMYRRGP